MLADQAAATRAWRHPHDRRFRAVTQMRTSERERWAGTAAPTPPQQPQPSAAAARQQQATRRLRPRASPAAPGTPAAPAPAPSPAGAAAPPPPPPPSARATRCCSLLFDYHTRHGAEQLRSRQHPAKCAACAWGHAADTSSTQTSVHVLHPAERGRPGLTHVEVLVLRWLVLSRFCELVEL